MMLLCSSEWKGVENKREKDRTEGESERARREKVNENRE